MARLNKWERQHLKDLSALDKRIEQIYEAAVKEAARIGATISDFNPDRLFSFSDYPITRKRIEKLLSGLKSGLSATIVNGINSAWTLSNNKNNELARQVFGDNVGKLSQAQYRRYFSTNDEAREAFIQRKTNGLNLSDRVWNYTNQFKEEIELGLDVSLRNGVSAEDMTKELRQYLKFPDKLFRRVRDEHGVLQLSKRAAAFHPGQGVYRSSFKNARRLATTETNIAYRTADYTRWQDLDFVVGIEIKLSNNHTLNGIAFRDICDELKGLYPKTFKFTGWHPLCRCYVVTILKTEAEMQDDNHRILNGKELSSSSQNSVDDVPIAFKQWLEQNKERIAIAGYKGKMPYFLIDNAQFVHLENFKATQRQIEFINNRKQYLNYNQNIWKRLNFDKKTGGFVVAHKSRLENAALNKQEQAKFEKEKEMAMTFSHFGYKIEMLKEVPRISSPDVTINGIKADLKRVSGENNIVKYADKAIQKQGADAILFQFDTDSERVHLELLKLKRKGYKVFYFFTGKEEIYEL